MPNTFEFLAREKKAAALADLLDAHGITAEQAASIDWGLWPQLAARAKVNAPSPTTVAHVVTLLAAREAAREQVAL